MEEFREFMKVAFVQGDIIKGETYGFLPTLFTVLMVGWLGYTGFVFFLNIPEYWEDLRNKWKRRPKDRFGRLVHRAVKTKANAKALLVAGPAVLIFLASLFLILVGLEVITPSWADDPQLFFNIGCIAFLVAFIYGAVLYFKYGNLEGVGAAFSYHLDYLPPQYVTETHYEKWDYEPDSAFRETSSTTYDVNEGENFSRAATNVTMRILAVIMVVFNVILFLVMSAVKCVFKLLSLPLGIGAIKRAESVCIEQMKDIAIGKGETDGLQSNWMGTTFIPSSAHLDADVRLAAAIEYGQFQYLFAQSAEGLSKGTLPLLIVTYGGWVYGGGMLFQAERKMCEWREGDLCYFVYESAHGRLFVTRNVMRKLSETSSLFSYYYPFNPGDLWRKELTGAPIDNSVGGKREATIMLQYHYLRFMKSQCGGDTVVRIAAFMRESTLITVKMVDVALKDVILDDTNKKYQLKNFK